MAGRPKTTGRIVLGDESWSNMGVPMKRIIEAAGFLSAEAIQEMLRRWLSLQAGESLRQIHRRMPDKELTQQIDQEIIEAVQAFRAERRG